MTGYSQVTTARDRKGVKREIEKTVEHLKINPWVFNDERRHEVETKMGSEQRELTEQENI